MTPMAHAIAKDAALPIVKRRFGDGAQQVGLFKGLHFFECSGVMQEARHLGCKFQKQKKAAYEKLAFLPFARTWIEFLTPESDRSKRCAYLLEHDGEDRFQVRMVYWDLDGEIEHTAPIASLPLYNSPDVGSYNLLNSGLKRQADNQTRQLVDATVLTIYGVLALINSPRITMREQHAPHAGLARALRDVGGIPGRFPLEGWDTITLLVQPPQIDNGPPHETHLTGERARHWVRHYTKISYGQVVYVREHERGHRRNGIKRTRYSVEMPPP
jgi:hypothetical protein